LIAPSGGSGTVLGESIAHPERFARRVGALIESPAFVGSLTGKDNLRSLAALRGVPGKRIDEVLHVVGLAGRENDKASTYSLGMKQRLGIAAALLPDPELLVLDEPTNGLDPAGIVEIRELLRSLASGGRTVVVSSHLLGEIQAMVDNLVVIRFGELMYAGSLEGLMEKATERVRMREEARSEVDDKAEKKPGEATPGAASDAPTSSPDDQAAPAADGLEEAEEGAAEPAAAPEGKAPAAPTPPSGNP
jgi:ABC-2 type transport system ATP-binding protein